MIQNAFATVEQCLNPFDRIPYIGSFSGMVRILAGAVQTIVAVIFGYLKSLFLWVTFSKFLIGETINQALIHTLHGLANVFRGAIAMLPWINTVLATYDYTMGRFNYPDEVLQSKVYPIATAKRLARY